MTTRNAPEQTAQEDVTRLREQIEQRTGKSPDQLYEEREQRLRDAIALKEPDRVPVVMGGGYFAARYAGVTVAAAYYDAATWKSATRKVHVELEPDVYRGTVIGAQSGLALGALGTTQTR